MADDTTVRVVAIKLGGETEGYLVVDLQNTRDGLGVTATEQAATVFALELAKLRSAEQAELRLRGGMLNELFNYPRTDVPELLRQAKRLGCDLRAQHVVTMIRFRSDDAANATSGGLRRQRLAENIARVCRGMSGGSVVAERGNTVVLLIPSEDLPAAQRIVNRAIDQCRAADLPDVIAGIGSLTHGLGDYAQSLAEATRAVGSAARINHPGPVIRFDQLDFHQLILGARPSRDIAILARRVLAPLLDYDTCRGGALVHTIHVYLECNGNAEAAARKLNLHPNSLRGRLERISKLLDRDLADATTRLDLFLALETYTSLANTVPDDDAP